MEKKTKRVKGMNHYNWAVACDAYLAVALIICDDLLQIKSDNIFSNLNFRSAHPNYELILPMIFNFKHGIELYLKNFSINSVDFYIQNHDIRELFEDIIASSKTEEVKLILQKLKTTTWPVIEKYYYGTYISINKFEVNPDKMNDAERYPKSNNSYNFGEIGEWYSNELIETIKKDILFIKDKFETAKRDIVE